MIGIPGGGSSLDLIDEACAVGFEFVRARTETHAAIMAALTGKPGVVLVGVGPGAASTVNGIAYARLERAPLLLFTDGPASSLHLAFDQSALFAPITKSQGRLRPGDGRARINPLFPSRKDSTATAPSTRDRPPARRVRTTRRTLVHARWDVPPLSP